ncbi:MAG TPA: hypothetical protein VGQ49_13985 [Bryobacteraceae bacterium]|jgi:hypothetical protein|nr:hypothetical protein [Bryobacteraceae bacterium]
MIHFPADSLPREMRAKSARPGVYAALLASLCMAGRMADGIVANFPDLRQAMHLNKTAV